MEAGESRRIRARWPLLLLAVAACSAPDDGQEQEAETASALARIAEVRAPEVEPVPDGTGPGARLADRRAMEEADAVFPHSEHRTLECQRCHSRPPGHETHRNAECSACHGRPAGFSSLPTRTAAECAACHHSDVTTDDCRGCHEVDEVGSRPVLVAIEAAGADAARVRPIPFDHGLHTTRECTSCHTTPATLRFGRDCSACHEAHHRPEARCMTCHPSVDAAAHDAAVHSGCAGTGCHEAGLVSTLEPMRNVCLVCHQELVEHKPGQLCIECHSGSWPPDPGPGRSGQ